jgi:hypothetical protein
MSLRDPYKTPEYLFQMWWKYREVCATVVVMVILVVAAMMAGFIDTFMAMIIIWLVNFWFLQKVSVASQDPTIARVLLLFNYILAVVLFMLLIIFSYSFP